LRGRFGNLFDSELRLQPQVTITPGSRFFLRDLDYAPAATPQLIAAACRALPEKADAQSPSFLVEGAADTPAVLLFRCAAAPQAVTLDGQPVDDVKFSPADKLLWIRFPNQAAPRHLSLRFP
jgi:hypothetical protein